MKSMKIKSVLQVQWVNIDILNFNGTDAIDIDKIRVNNNHIHFINSKAFWVHLA